MHATSMYTHVERVCIRMHACMQQACMNAFTGHGKHQRAKPHISNEPYTQAKEPYTQTKEPYTQGKEPYTQAKEP